MNAMAGGSLCVAFMLSDVRYVRELDQSHRDQSRSAGRSVGRPGRRQPFAGMADPADPARRIPGDQREGGHVARHHRPGRDEAVSPDRAPQTIVALAPMVAPRRTRVGAELVLALDFGPGVEDVGEDAGRTAEHAIFQRHALDTG